MQEKGYLVQYGIPTLIGFAKISDLAKTSYTKYDEYQQNLDIKHTNDIVDFMDNCKEEAKFLPEVVLSVNNVSNAILKSYDHKSLKTLTATAKGAIKNMDFYSLEIEEGSFK